jgi:hypothetical protein
MKTNLIRNTLGAVALSLTVTGSAQAAMIAGWDFSQYVAPGELTQNFIDYTNTLGANYSNLDATSGLGPDSAVFGVLYFDGSFGSTNVNPTSLPTAVTPASLSLASNINAPVTGGGVLPFNSFESLIDQGQEYATDLQFQIQSAVSFVLAAYTTTIPGLGSDWSVSFGGQTDSGTSTIGIEFSTDGINFTPFGTQTLTTLDSQFSVPLGDLPSEAAFVRFNVNPTGAGTRIDNVALNGSVVVPEPGTVVLLGIGLSAVALMRRRLA